MIRRRTPSARILCLDPGYPAPHARIRRLYRARPHASIAREIWTTWLDRFAQVLLDWCIRDPEQYPFSGLFILPVLLGPSTASPYRTAQHPQASLASAGVPSRIK
ncbi:hypothetical protein BOTBODRAFT_292229 [Botryobasidium botryosum FD-172 SS1]|uniref:Uncharacterized protein n=1 Tax=Botryobasidium botryosum (strain FD-172 SS1) TaxID=930990 RepID=A0A067MV65_BOTB1|nr:hypothetical protein BOTBODRAFT_292229 [Botryobasidium botryosum FD-172 SS1]